MPAVVYGGDIESKLPAGLTSMDINSLTSCTDLVGKYVQATVHHRYQLYKKLYPSLKLVLANSQGSVIDLLALGQVAVDLDICVIGDILVFLKFEVEAMPKHCKGKYQIIVDDNRDVGSLVWIFKQANKSKETPQARTQQIPTQPRSYTYKPLAQLKVNTIVDVYGVVKSYKPPTESRGSDFYCKISLVDPSLENGEDPLSCNLFSRSESYLPRLQVGNVIRFHRLKIQAYHERKQGNNGPGFQWLLFRESVEDREASSSSYTFEQQDEEMVKSLLEWWQKKGNDLSASRESKKLCEVQVKEYFDLVCQVIRICDLDGGKFKVLRVWDGTKCESELKMTQEGEFNEKVLEDGTLMEISAGLAVDVYLFDNHVTSVDGIKPGDFILLTNLHAALVSGLVELTLHGGTWFNKGVALLSTDSLQARELQLVLEPIRRNKSNNSLLPGKHSAERVLNKAATLESCLKTINTFKNSKKVSSPEAAMKEGSSIEKQILLEYSEMVAASIETAERGHCCGSGNKAGLKRLNTDCDCENIWMVDNGKRRCLEDPSKQNLHTSVTIIDNEDLEASFVGSEEMVETAKEMSGNSSQSIWCSAFEDSDMENQTQVETGEAGFVSNASQLQDSKVSSSGPSASSQCLQCPDDNNTGSRGLSQQCQAALDVVHSSSQESFYLAESQDIIGSSVIKRGDSKDYIEPNVIKLADSGDSIESNVNQLADKDIIESNVIHPHRFEIGPSQRVLLSLKSKPDLQVTKDLPLSVNRPDDLDSRVLCSNTEAVQDVSPVVNEQDVAFIEETEEHIDNTSQLHQNTSEEAVNDFLWAESAGCLLSQMTGESECQDILNNDLQNTVNGNIASSVESGRLLEEPDKQLRCMLKTASTVIDHQRVPRSSLKEVLEHAVPYKFKVLVRVQEIKPRPTSAACLVHFCCSYCQHKESALSAKYPLDGNFLEHICPISKTQPVRLKPHIILAFSLTDGKHSIEALLWENEAVQFFNGIEPLQLLSYDDSFHQVQDWLESLCPLNSDIDDRPLLECCLFSYKTVDCVKYQLFDTMLV